MERKVLHFEPSEFFFRTAQLCGLIDYCYNNNVIEELLIINMSSQDKKKFNLRQMQAFFRAFVSGKKLIEELESDNGMRQFFPDFSLDQFLHDEYIPRIENGIKKYQISEKFMNGFLPEDYPQIPHYVIRYWENLALELN